jgi:two-component system chemotaxis response regulator CheB
LKQFVSMMQYEAVVIGASSGGWEALAEIFQALPGDFSLPIIVAQHLHPLQDAYFFTRMNDVCTLSVKDADEKELIKPGFIYFAPPNYHLLIEKDRTFSLSVDELVNFSRPAIDVLFESAAEVYQDKLIGVILSGGNQDGARGLKLIKENFGLTIVQDPATSQTEYMPQAAIKEVEVDHVLPLSEIGPFLTGLGSC